MLILAIRTDNPEAEIGIYQDARQLSYYSWQAHRQLAETIHLMIAEQLKQAGHKLADVQAIVIYKGPGSFTGLRIGAAVANALAASLPAHIVGETGEKWQERGINRLISGETEVAVMPEYGAPVHITVPKH
jgi:tRNA threonylcarbamoyladenosine biosynthesis protein TsaB